MTTTTTLSNGTTIPNIGLGLWQVPADDVQHNVEQALEIGYRHFDGASAYGNEEGFGAAIRATAIPREELFVTTKLNNPDQGYDAALKGFDASMDRLGLDYVDLYLIHWPMPKRGLYIETWKAFEEIYQAGRTKAIGISNFMPEAIDTLLEASAIAPMVNQIETHPFCQQMETQKFLRENTIQIESWASFAEGKNDIFTHPVLTAIGQRHGKSVAQVILRWLIEREVVVIPKTVNKARMAENIDVFDFELGSEDKAAIAKLNTGASAFLDHRDPATVKWLTEVRFDI